MLLVTDGVIRNDVEECVDARFVKCDGLSNQ